MVEFGPEWFKVDIISSFHRSFLKVLMLFWSKYEALHLPFPKHLYNIYISLLGVCNNNTITIPQQSCSNRSVRTESGISREEMAGLGGGSLNEKFVYCFLLCFKGSRSLCKATKAGHLAKPIWPLRHVQNLTFFLGWPPLCFHSH